MSDHSKISIAAMNQRAARALLAESRLLLLLAAANGLLSAGLVAISQAAGGGLGLALLAGILGLVVTTILMVFWARVVAPNPVSPLSGGLGDVAGKGVSMVILNLKITVVVLIPVIVLTLLVSIVASAVGLEFDPEKPESLSPLLFIILIMALPIILYAVSGLYIGWARISIGMDGALEFIDNAMRRQWLRLIAWSVLVLVPVSLINWLVQLATGLADTSLIKIALQGIIGFTAPAYIVAGLYALSDFQYASDGEDQYAPSPQERDVNIDDQL